MNINKKKFFISSLLIISLISIFIIIFMGKIFIKSKITKFIKNYQPVSSVTTQKSKIYFWNSYIESLGIISPINGINISAINNGKIAAILFKSGDIIKKGQPLLLIDDTVDKTNLFEAIAEAKLAKMNYIRQKFLYERHIISKSILDKTKAVLLSRIAKIIQYKNIINEKKIRAPFSGKIGIFNVHVGQYIAYGDIITYLKSIGPTYVSFQIKENNISHIYIGQKIIITMTAYPNTIFKGKITAIDTLLSNNIKSIKVQGIINNPLKKDLLPGMSGNIKIILSTKNKVIAIPQESIVYTLYGNFVYTVSEKKDHKNNKIKTYAKRTYIKLGEQRENLIAVTGIKKGERIIIDGQTKLHDGSLVRIVTDSVNNKSKKNKFLN